MTTPGAGSMSGASALRSATLAYTLNFLDEDQHMVLNPPGTHETLGPPGSLHLVPNTCWAAYALLASGRGQDAEYMQGIVRRVEPMLRAIIDLQLNEPGTAWHGTFRRFLEWPAVPPEQAQAWVDYDPNWRQFVASAFVVIIQEFEETLSGDLVRDLEASVHEAVTSEPFGRISLSYTNPRLMQVCAVSWLASRRHDSMAAAIAETEMRAIAARHAALGNRFDEFNSPTYEGINLMALSIMVQTGATQQTRRLAGLLREALWDQIMALFVPELGNLAGPFSRSYYADMNNYASITGMWIWARCGRWFGPDFRGYPHMTLHGHDLMVGTIVADLADHWGPAVALPKTSARDHALTFGHRKIYTWIRPTWAVGVDASTEDPDWVGAQQRMPFVIQALDQAGHISCLWAEDGVWRVISPLPNLTLEVEKATAIHWSAKPASVTDDEVRFRDVTVTVGNRPSGHEWFWSHQRKAFVLREAVGKLHITERSRAS